MNRLHTGDSVVVIAGKHKGAKSTIIAVKGEWVTLKGVNIQKKAVKGEGFKEKEGTIHCSNVSHWDEKSSSSSRIGVRTNKKGGKERFYKKSGEVVKK